MEGTPYTTKQLVLKRGEEIVGIPLKEIGDSNELLKKNKGGIGVYIERYWFNYKPNSDSEPDFPEAGVELKVTPFTFTKKNVRRAKERLVCNIINYMEEYKITNFYESSFMHKCKTMLIMPYEHKADMPKTEYTIDKAVLFSIPEEDFEIFVDDWEKIVEKIRTGNAHLLSEGDTLYLGACTKGENSKTLREQPFSDTPAKQRAFSIKQSYMTYILNTYIYGDRTSESIIKDWRILGGTTFEDYIVDKLSPFYGKTLSELKEQFEIKSNPKNIVEILLGKMLGINGTVNKSAEFIKAGIVTKTVRLLPDGKPKESMSFKAFDFIEICNETWEESEIHELFSTTKFMFVVFQSEYTNNPEEMITDYGIANGKFQAAPEGVTDFKFKRVKFWNMPEKDLEEVEKVWTKTVNTIKEGVVLTETQKGTKNNLPKMTESTVMHVRPHASDSNDTAPLPDGREMTKQAFWLNANYVQKIVAPDETQIVESYKPKQIEIENFPQDDDSVKIIEERLDVIDKQVYDLLPDSAKEIVDSPLLSKSVKKLKYKLRDKLFDIFSNWF